MGSKHEFSLKCLLTVGYVGLDCRHLRCSLLFVQCLNIDYSVICMHLDISSSASLRELIYVKAKQQRLQKDPCSAPAWHLRPEDISSFIRTFRVLPLRHNCLHIIAWAEEFKVNNFFRRTLCFTLSSLRHDVFPTKCKIHTHTLLLWSSWDVDVVMWSEMII